MKISYSPYQLVGFLKRKGALIRIEIKGDCGYADLHPWPELGDEPLNKQLSNFGNTPLTRQALKHALMDLEGRCKGISLLEGLNIPQSHYLITQEDFPEDWGFYKIKLKDIRYLDLVPPGAKVRIDCNGGLSFREAEDLLKKLNPAQVDFVEDPTPYSDEGWYKLKRFGIPLAGDRFKGKYADIQVMKPACDNMETTISQKKIVVTSYLGHPLGQVIAAYYAGYLNKQIPINTCGLLSHHAYIPNSYSQCLSQNGPFFKIPAGTGFGFDDLLYKEEWHALRFHNI